MKQNAFVLKCIGIYSIFANFACYADLCVFCCSCSCSFVLLFSSSSYHLKFNVCTGAIMSIVCNTVRLLCCAIPRFGSLYISLASIVAAHISISTFCHIQTNPTLFVLLPRFMTYVPCDSSNGNVLHTCIASQICLRSH